MSRANSYLGLGLCLAGALGAAHLPSAGSTAPVVSSLARKAAGTVATPRAAAPHSAGRVSLATQKLDLKRLSPSDFGDLDPEHP